MDHAPGLQLSIVSRHVAARDVLLQEPPREARAGRGVSPHSLVLSEADLICRGCSGGKTGCERGAGWRQPRPAASRKAGTCQRVTGRGRMREPLSSSASAAGSRCQTASRRKAASRGTAPGHPAATYRAIFKRCLPAPNLRLAECWAELGPCSAEDLNPRHSERRKETSPCQELLQGRAVLWGN